MKQNQFEKAKNNFTGLYFLGYRDNTEYEEAEIVVLPVGYQGTCSWGKGTKNGPKALLNASLNLEPFDEEAMFSLNKTGVHTLKIQSHPDNKKAETVVKETRALTKQIMQDNKFPVMIGGEHSISIGTIQAVAEKYNNLSVLQLDAHTDLDEAYKYEEYSHASMARKVITSTQGAVKFTQVGIRSVVPEHLKYAQQTKTNIFFAHNIINNKHTIKDITNTLKKDVYITIDVDAFDPSIFPNTGTPEPNGLRWQYIINLIHEVAKTRNIVGLDIVEHASDDPEAQHFSDFSAAKLLHKVLCLIQKYKQ